MKKNFILIIAILCIACTVFAFAACQPTDDTTPSGQPSGSASSGSINSGSIDSGDTTPSGSVDSGEVIPSGSIDSGNQPSGEVTSGEIPSGSISSGEITSGEVGSGEIGSGEQPTYVKNITDLVENYSNEVYSALEDNFLEGAGKSVYGSRSFDSNKLVSVVWDLGTSNEINEIKFISTYAVNSSVTTYGIGAIKLNQTINVTDLTEDNITSTINNATASYSKEYSFNYSPAIQDSRADLTNAICDTVFGENESATRYIVDNGYKVDDTLNEAREFKVIEITDNGVQEVSIRIKNASSDESFIANLKNSSNYYSYDKNSYELSGNKVEENNI